MRTLIQDLQYAARMLRRAPLFSGVAILTLSLCIGANSALFSIVNAVLLQPLPFERADQLYVVSGTYETIAGIRGLRSTEGPVMGPSPSAEGPP